MPTEVGPVEIEVPRDREHSFEPQIVKKRQRRLSGVDEMVLSLAESADALSAAADELSTAASAHTRDEVATSAQEPAGGGRVFQEIVDLAGALVALGHQGSSARASGSEPPRADRYCAGHPIALKTATGSR
jgi:hypothetical protein